MQFMLLHFWHVCFEEQLCVQSCSISYFCVLQIAVALVKSMKLQRGRDEAEQAAAFAKAIHQKWGVGASTCDNGLVLFLSKDDRQVCFTKYY